MLIECHIIMPSVCKFVGFVSGLAFAGCRAKKPVSPDICVTRSEASVVLLCYDEAQRRAEQFMQLKLSLCIPQLITASLCNAL
jgi:hypothetical protein